MRTHAFITGLSGLELTRDERAFLKDARPWGVILFKRNINDPAQVSALTAEIRACLGCDAPILIDQEGGRVQRMGPPHWPRYPTARTFSRIANDRYTQRDLARLGARLMAHDLLAVGVTVDCLPVLDVPVPGANEVIGDRAYGGEPDDVAVLGRAAAEGLIAGGVMPVMKHVPGHGRAGVDSHLSLPVVDATREELAARDFRPFAMLADLPAAMTAHVVFSALDAERPATTSRKIVRKIIRREIGFDGLLMTDDLSMKALSGGFRQRTEAALAAGCDLALHCNGDLDEMRAVAEGAPRLSGKAKRRAEAALARTRHVPEPIDVDEARARLSAALAATA